MKASKILKRTTALVLAISMLFSGNRGISTLEADEALLGEDTIVSFPADMYDYGNVGDPYSSDDYNLKWINEYSLSPEVRGEKSKGLLFTAGGYLGATEGCSEDIRQKSFNISDSNRSLYDVGVYYPTVYQGIMKPTLVNGLPAYSDDFFGPDLFGLESTHYKKVYQDVNVQFKQSVIDGVKNYVLDSSQNQYTYDTGSNTVWVTDGNPEGNFWPFGQRNYWFGLNFQVDFTMNEYGTVDNTADGTASTFEFSGDDDVWVYIDDTLVLDLGGIHSACSGYIDFKSGVSVVNSDINTSENIYGANDAFGATLDESKILHGKTVSLSDLGVNVKDGQKHTLRVFYLERGGVLSNCKITFNMPVVNSNIDKYTDVSFEKVDGYKKEALPGAGFTLYSDSNCTNALQEVFSGEDGVVTFKDLNPGEYYFKETTAPEGYDANDILYKAVVSIDSSDNFIVSLFSNVGGTWASIWNDELGKNVIENYYTIVTEEYDKTAEVLDWDDRTYTINLSANVLKSTAEISTSSKPVDVILVMDASRSMWFPGDLTSIGNQKISNIKNAETLAKNNQLYIMDKTNMATVYRVYKKNGVWYKVDSSDALDPTKPLPAGVSITVLDTNQSYNFYKSVGTSDGRDYADCTRINELKAAASAFATSLAEKSPESNIGIVTFNKDAKSIFEPQKVTIDNAANAISSLDYSDLASGTYHDTGLTEAQKMLNSDLIKNSGHEKYVILITDGCSNNDTVVNNSIAIANTMKNDNGATVVYVGVDMKTIQDVARVQNLSQGVASEGMIKWADAKDLGALFASLVQEVTCIKTNALTADVIDYIDPRFELVKINGVNIADGIPDGVTCGTGANGLSYVKFSDVELNGWTKQLTVRAKLDYMGGNVITTNGSGSGIYIGEEMLYEFDEPSVNVKRLDLFEKDKEKTVFIGDTLIPSSAYDGDTLVAGFVDELRSTFKYGVEGDVVESRNRQYDIPEGCALTAEELRQLMQGEEDEIVKPYTYAGFEDGQFVYTYETVKGDVEEHQAKEVGEHVEDYKITVSYEPYERTGANSVNPGPQVEDTSVDSHYYVNVKEGELVVSKVFEGDFLSNLPYSSYEKDKVDAVQTAVFTINRYDINDPTKLLDSFQITLTGKDNEEASATIKHLPAGIYEVVEDEDWSWKYVLESVTENGKSSDEESGDAMLGDKQNQHDGFVYIGTQKADDGTESTYTSHSVKFVNKLDTAKTWFADTFNVRNVFNGK